MGAAVQTVFIVDVPIAYYYSSSSPPLTKRDNSSPASAFSVAARRHMTPGGI